MDKGRDFSGWDCWGPIYQAYRMCREIELPLGTDQSYRNEDEALTALMNGAQAWQEISFGQERSFDVALFRPCHVGLITRPGWMLNARGGRRTLVERYDLPLWKSYLIGIYRHEQPGV